MLRTLLVRITCCYNLLMTDDFIFTLNINTKFLSLRIIQKTLHHRDLADLIRAYIFWYNNTQVREK